MDRLISANKMKESIIVPKIGSIETQLLYNTLTTWIDNQPTVMFAQDDSERSVGKRERKMNNNSIQQCITATSNTRVSNTVKIPVMDGTTDGDTISRQAAIDELWKALFEYEDKTEKQFQESEDLDLRDWMVHRIFVQNMSDIDRQTILNLPSAQP